MVDLSPESKFRMTFGALVAVVVFAAVGGWRANALLTSIDARLRTIESGDKDRWNKAEAVEWAYRLMTANPNMRMPDPRDPMRMLSRAGDVSGDVTRTIVELRR